MARGIRTVGHVVLHRAHAGFRYFRYVCEVI